LPGAAGRRKSRYEPNRNIAPNIDGKVTSNTLWKVLGTTNESTAAIAKATPRPKQRMPKMIRTALIKPPAPRCNSGENMRAVPTSATPAVRVRTRQRLVKIVQATDDSYPEG
jgi:hypothetical protein